MADDQTAATDGKTVTINVGGDSPEYVALLLMDRVAFAERLDSAALALEERETKRDKRTGKQWILETYAECLKVVRGT